MAKLRWTRALALALLIGPAGVATVNAAPAPAVRAAQVANPFGAPNVFCTPHAAPAGRRNTSSPGVSANAINITDMSIDTKGLRAFGADLQDFNAAYRAYFNEINTKCGGINGRKIVLRTAKYNPLAVDQAGHQQAICLKATEDQKAFVVVGIGQPQVQRCVSVNHKSIMIGNNNVPRRDYVDSKGRFFAIYPSANDVGTGFANDAAAQGLFRGKKVGIITDASSPTAVSDLKERYTEPLRKKGVEVAAVEVLPCIGTVCTQGVGGAVTRLKAKGVEVLLITQDIVLTTSGTLFREMRNQNLRVPIYGPFAEGLHGDSTVGSVIRTAGADGARFLDSVGWYATNMIEVYNAWRVGTAKETPMAKMCTATLAKSGLDRQYLYNERDISAGRWGGTANICIQVRAVASAIWSLGANVTTERLVAAMKNLKAADFKRDTGPAFRNRLFFNGTDTAPTSGVVVKFNFPCPLPRALTNEGCFLPVDRPARVRRISA